MDNQTLTQFILAMVGSLLGLSFLVELIPQWGTLSADRKTLIVRAVVVVLALVGYVLSRYNPDLLKMISDGATVIAGVVGAYGVQQGYHKLAKPSGEVGG